MTTPTESFRNARDFLLEHREDYATAYEGFSWPRPEYFNWALDWFDAIADGNDRTALHLVEEDGSGARYSFAEMSERSARVANWLRARGVRPGDRVLLMLGNQVELWETALAAMKLRAVVIPATPLLGPADLLLSNILRTVNTALLPAIARALRPGGIAIFSGMEVAEAPLFVTPLEAAGFDVEQELSDTGWWGVAARRR